MQLGFGVLRLSSQAFWRMTPRELAAASVGLYGTRQRPLTQLGLFALMGAFPDESSRNE